MTEGEKIQDIRRLTRNDLVQDERIAQLEKMVYEIKEIMKSPIRRAIHAVNQERK